MKSTTSRNWLHLSLASLLIPGISAIVLVLLRTLEVSQQQWGQLFKLALVIHVDLSVYVWMVSGVLFLWSFTTTINHKLQTTLFLIATLGAILMAGSVFIGSPTPILNNYIPVLESLWFFLGLGLFSLASVAMAVLAFNSTLVNKLLAGILLIAVLLTLDSLRQLNLNLENYYEFLFWGGGHVLQFMASLLMLKIWLIIHNSCNLAIKARLQNFLFVLMALPVLYGLFIHLNYSVDSGEYRLGMTDMMAWGNGIAPIITAIFILSKIKINSLKNIAGISLYCSIFMFLTGGLIALFIYGVNTIIPAHYHGSIVGVTLSIMGLIYYYLPQMGIELTMKKTAYAQPIIYTLGQLMHILGLTISGVNGASRKTLGVTGNLEHTNDISLLLTRFGGLLAVIGGIMFLVVIYYSIIKANNKSDVMVEQ